MGALIGGIIASIWGFISWKVLPWHDWAFQSFRNQEFVAWVLKENTKKDGTYLIPHFQQEEALWASQEQGVKSDLKKKSQREGPFVQVQIKRKGLNTGGFMHYMTSFFTQCVGAGLISFLLLQGVELRYQGRLLFVTLVGLIVGVLGYVPKWNWFGGNFSLLLIHFIDLLITWFLVGLVLAAFVRKRYEHALMED